MLLLPLFLILCLLPPSTPAVSPVVNRQTQQGALLALKYSWKDPDHHLADWKPSNSQLSYCSWTGVLCADSSVVGLTLDGFRLGGSLSPVIAFLPDLQILRIPGNQLAGTIPSKISQLRNLTALDLSNNAFQGQVPTDIFSDLTLVVELKLSFNQLQGPIPEQMGFLAYLQRLELRHNSFSGSVPRNLSGAVSLQYLVVENNNLSGEFPSGIGLLPHLKYLSFSNNSISGAIPADFVHLRGVAAIYAGWNKLNGTIPQQFGNLSRLIHLQLQGNHLEGEIPNSFGSLRELKELLLYDNKISGPIPVELGELKNITILDLSKNSLNGSIPAALCNMSAMETLNLQDNDLTSSITPALGNLSFLKSLKLAYNNLSGEVPVNGVLLNFSASSFEGNFHLCGGPLVNHPCSFPAVPAPPSRRSVISRPSAAPRNNQKSMIMFSVVGSAIGVSLLAVVVINFFRRRERKVQIQDDFNPDLSVNIQKSTMQMSVPLIRFSYAEIVSHAGCYNTAHELGKGRFATMYRSTLPGGTELAVKVFKYPILQCAFEREMELLQTVKFRNILPIRGYYSNPAEKAIFYDVMPRGTLYDLLHCQPKNSGTVTLPDWSQRLSIALGVAQALAHLNRASNLQFVHKDLKSTNVLLDKNMTPFVTDYALVGLVSGNSSFVETPGYAPPELSSTKRYSEKTDVYSFGVVLLELLTGKKPVSYVGNKELNLSTWVVQLQKAGRGNEVLDALLIRTCPSPDHAETALKLAILCLSEHPAQRPTMPEVVTVIESLVKNDSPSTFPATRS